MRIPFDELQEGQIIFQIWSSSFAVYFISRASKLTVMMQSLTVDVDSSGVRLLFNNGVITKRTWDETINADANLYPDDEFRRHQAIWAIFEGIWT